MSEFPATDLYNRAHNLGLPADRFVVAGSSVVEAVVGPGKRRADDMDIVVDEETYQHLRGRSDLQELVEPDGYRHLRGGSYDISVGWGGRSADELRRHGYRHQGVCLAGLPEVYEYKQRRGLPKDKEDLQLIRDRLYGSRPLPPGMLQGEMGFLRRVMPERLLDRPELLVAANGLYIVRTVFGHEQEGVRTYSGLLENAAVPATFHGWEHSAYGVEDGQGSMQRRNAELTRQGRPPMYSDDDRLAHAAGFANHDAKLGHGRRAMNPAGHDELQSADLVARHLEAVGASVYVQEGAHATVMVTTFNEAKKAQDIDPARGYVHLQEVGAGSDMWSFRRPGVKRMVALTVEDLFRKGAAYDQPLQRLLDGLNANLPEGAQPVAVRTTQDGLRLIDKYPDFKVVKNTPDGPQEMTLKEAFVSHLRGSQWFAANYRFPENWRTGTLEQQQANAQAVGDLAGRVERGELSAEDSYDAARPAQETVIRDAAAPSSGEAVRAGGAPSVEVLCATIQGMLAQLPAAEFEAAAPLLSQIEQQLAVTIQSTDNEHAAAAAEAIMTARQTLDTLRQAIATAADELAQYSRDLA